MRYHMIAFFSGFLLDLLFGDPHFLPHPVRGIGKLIAVSEKRIRRMGEQGNAESEFRKGICLTVFVSVSVTTVALCFIIGAYALHPYVGVMAETIMTYQILATRCLKDESMKVYRCLRAGALEEARHAVSMIVGRDTAQLDEEGVVKAAIETVAENTSDGVTAPMLYLAVGGPALGFFYKAVNTMDSMIGYKNEKYLYFGRAAARLDDILNFIPARISAVLMIAAAYLPGKEFFWRDFFDGSRSDRDFSGRQAVRIYRRDRKKHASPNAAQTESVCAGALGIRLAGDARYFGKVVKKPYIGDALRGAVYEDIRRVNCLMYRTVWVCEILCLLLMLFLEKGGNVWW